MNFLGGRTIMKNNLPSLKIRKIQELDRMDEMN